MKILSLLAQRIINEVTKVIEEEVIVVDKEGTIIAGSDKNRIGMFHEGALRAIKTKRKWVITEADVQRLQGVKVGINLPITFQNEVVGVIGITGNPKDISQFGELIKRMTELIIQEAHSAEQLESKLRGIETFIYEWLHITDVDETFLHRGEILGIPMDVPRCCVLFQISNLFNQPSADLAIEKECMKRIREQFEIQAADALVQWGEGRIVLLKSFPRHEELSTLVKQLKKLLVQCRRLYQIDLSVGIGTIQPATKLAISYEQAKRALRFSQKHGGVLLYEQLTLEIALAEISRETKEQLVERQLGSILHEQELLETLAAYFDCKMSMKATAEMLHIHINTLHYRMRRIQTLTEEDLKEPKSLAAFYIAYLFWQELR